MNLPRLLTPQETSEALGITPAILAVWRTTKRYGLSYVKCGRLIRYIESDIADFIKRWTHDAGE